MLPEALNLLSPHTRALEVMAAEAYHEFYAIDQPVHITM